MNAQRGGFLVGMVVGLLIGLALALGVSLYITKAPVPFINKVPGRTAEQDSAEAERNRNWDPNAPLGGKSAARPAPAASGTVEGAAAPAAASGPAATTASRAGRDPAAILSGAAAPGAAASAVARPGAAAADPFVYFVQAGAYTRNDDAEQQKAKLALMGHNARISEREQSGRTVYRVRVGPFATRDEADGLQVKLAEAGVDAQIVRVDKPADKP